MSEQHFTLNIFKPLFLVLLFSLSVAYSAHAANEMTELLPPVSCGGGWKIEGTPLFYDRDTLSDRINGEAELYFPYDFDALAASRYASEKHPGAGMDVEIYRMGSTLDAFGIYANYRQTDGSTPAIGTEANLSGSQLFLYQGRYFVHIQTTGSATVDSISLAECAKTVTSRIHATDGRPVKLALFDLPQVVKGTERYLPRSLLGYDFLNRGIIADALLEGATLQIFLLLDTTAESATAAFERFRSQLTQVKIEADRKNTVIAEGVDSLYGRVILLRSGNCFSGAVRSSRTVKIRALLESVCR